MSKALSEMTLEELWELFPILLVPHQNQWETWYLEEAEQLQKRLKLEHKWRLHHIGSTALKDIWAKPTIDILLEMPAHLEMDSLKAGLESQGYTCMSQAQNRISFCKGYTEKGFAERVFHLHVRYFGDNDELYFRDYLQEHKGLALEYEALKKELCKVYEHNRDAYTEAKTAFISEWTERAKKNTVRDISRK